MIDLVIQLLRDGWASVLGTFREMLPVTAFFLFLGMLVKRSALFADMRRAAAEAGLNIQILLFNLIVIGPLLILGSQAMVWAFFTNSWSLIDREFWHGRPALLVVLLGVFLGDLFGYWRHRQEHTRLLWPSHAVHHSDTEMTWLTLERFHPINRITRQCTDQSRLPATGEEGQGADNHPRHCRVGFRSVSSAR